MAVPVIMPAPVRLMEQAAHDLFGELRNIPLDDLKAIQAPVPYRGFVDALIAVRMLMGVE